MGFPWWRSPKLVGVIVLAIPVLLGLGVFIPILDGAVGNWRAAGEAVRVACARVRNLWVATTRR